MHVERLLQINTATLAALGTLLLGMGQRNTAVPLFVVAVAAIAIWVTDVQGRLYLTRGAAGLLQVAGLAVTLVWLPMRGLHKEMLILSLAQLLIYWQVVVLFQKKDTRTYWYQTQLSLLQVVVAALLSQGFFFGAMLIVYLMTALSALTLIFLHEERNRYQKAGEPPARPVDGSRWPLARQEAVFTGPMTGRLGVEREMFGRILKTAAVSLVLSVIVFFVVPRMGQGAWRGSGFAPGKTVGYNDSIRLGGLGDMIDNPQEVLRIQFHDEASGRPYTIGDPIYLRGTVLALYGNGQWKAPRKRLDRVWDRRPARRAEHGEDLVRQTVVVEPLSKDDLFCVWPFHFPTSRPPIAFDPSTNRLSRQSSQSRGPFTYHLLTTAFDDGALSRIIPNDEEADTRELLQMPTATGGSPLLPGLVALARQWVDGSDLPPEDRMGRATLLESKLRDSGQFKYSMKGVNRDWPVDPIEDFITKHPEGHCEYFATALAMMLRSQGIPSRVVIGYRTEDWSPTGNFYLVRQLHAHAWVEAYLEFEQVPAVLRQNPHFLSGGWLRLDPSPGGEMAAGGFLALTQGLNWLDYLWARYVVQMDGPRQQEAVYSPVANAVKDAAGRVTDPSWWRRLFRGLREFLGLGQWGGEWMDGIMAATLAVVIALPFYRGARWLWDVFVRRAKRRPQRARKGHQSNVVFYRRLETALARHGLVRPASHTQREFAREAGKALAGTTGNADLGALPAMVVEAFYRVRFGGSPLDKEEEYTIERALGELERAGNNHQTAGAS